MLCLIGRNIQLAFAFVYAPWINLHRHFIVASQLKNSLISSRTKCGRAARVSNLSFSRLIASSSYAQLYLERNIASSSARAHTDADVGWKAAAAGGCCWRARTHTALVPSAQQLGERASERSAHQRQTHRASEESHKRLRAVAGRARQSLLQDGGWVLSLGKTAPRLRTPRGPRRTRFIASSPEPPLGLLTHYTDNPDTWTSSPSLRRRAALPPHRIQHTRLLQQCVRHGEREISPKE